MTENDKKNKELAELLGIHPHRWIPFCDGWVCTVCNQESDTIIKPSDYPDFTSDESKVMLLRLMMERGEDWFRFVKSMNIGIVRRDQCGHRFVLLHTNYITDTTGKLRDACLEWLRREK